jgi:exodeoxyribonuclease V beta subunit
MSRAPWNILDPLPEGAAWLLEASAGTGKTFQLASLFLRLVGEYGLAIDRILAMTFTNAATSELRERVRQRMAAAQAVCASGGPSNGDPVLEHVRARVTDAELASRFAVALQSFDAAPISTIHGFAQRMLHELAFEVGHDRGLTLAESTDDLVGELVDDTLADLWARATLRQVRVLDSLGIRRAKLTEVARAALGAQSLRVEASQPAAAGASPWSPLLEAIAALFADVDAFAGAYFGAADHPCFTALEGAIVAKAFNRTKLREDRARRSFEAIRVWCLAGGAKSKELAKDLERLEEENVLSARRGGRAGLEAEAYFPFLRDYWALRRRVLDFYEGVERYGAFTATVRPRIEASLAARRLLTFDALVARIAERIEEERAASGTSPLAKALRERFDAILVDEFQDTDAAQWTMLREAFLDHRRLFLIGDPKQAIYSFRGANVHVYLSAAEAVHEDRRRTMATNWRSDATAIEAMNALFRAGSSSFDVDALDYVEVSATGERIGAGVRPALDLRWMDDRLTGGVAGSAIRAKESATRLAADLAADEIVALLASPPAGLGPLGPRDFAVLTATHRQAEAVRRALLVRGVPAVSASKGSVFASEAALWLTRWLAAVASRGHAREVRALALTPLVGWTGEQLAAAREEAPWPAGSRPGAAIAPSPTAALEALLEHARAVADRWAREGFGRLFDRDLLYFEAFTRILAMPLGERHATDLRHLLEVVHAHARRHRPSPGALAAWVAAARAESDSIPQDRVQRLESDDRAVTIETVHLSKGLEYPIVLLPFCWDERAFDPGEGPIKVQGPSGTVLNVEGSASPRRRVRAEDARHEERREAQRKLYVALTRAVHRTVVWFGPVGEGGRDLAATAFGRLVLREPGARGLLEGGTLLAPIRGRGANVPVDASEGDALLRVVAERLDALQRTSAGSCGWDCASAPPREPSRATSVEVAPPLRAAEAWPSDRPLLLSPWQTTSFTGLTRAAAHAAEVLTEVPAEPAPGALDELHAEEPTVMAPARTTASASLLLSHPGGAAYGTFVHAVLEHVDFTTGASRDGRAVLDRARDEARRAAVPSAAAEELASAIPALLAAPLARPEVALPAGFSLSCIAPADRLDELAFDLRLGAGTGYVRGDRARGLASLEGLFAAMRAHPEVLPSAWVRDFEARSGGGRAAAGLVGILRGAIDLVFRTHGERNAATDEGGVDTRGARTRSPERHARYWIADYKTNRLRGASLDPYVGDGLREAMVAGDYLLQALIYTVALHRELRVRLRDYAYERHVGGFVYLFVRGMGVADAHAGEASPGVYAARFPEALVAAADLALSSLADAAPCANGVAP